MSRVVIIGAGVGGLATANLLAAAGYKVAVYEQNDGPGGRAGRLELGGFSFDTGPSWYLMPEVFEHYFRLFGVSTAEVLAPRRLSPAYKVFYEQDPPITVTSDLEQDAATFEAVEPGAGQRLQEYVATASQIYDLSLEHFLYTNFSSAGDLMQPAVVKRAVTMGRLALTPIDTYVSRFFTDQRLRQIVEYPMVFLGASPFKAPAIYSLMSALDFGRGVFYPKGGLYSIVEQLVAIGTKLGVEYYYQSGVQQIITRNGQATGLELADGTHVGADIVISGADLHYTETQLLKAANQSYPASYWAGREAGPSALLMYLGVRGELPQLEHHNLFFASDWRGNFEAIFESKELPWPASLYVCRPSATDETVAPSGHENLFVLVPLPAGIELQGHALEAAADHYLDVIADKLAVPDLRERLVVRQLFGPQDFSATFNAWQGTALGPSHILRQSAVFRTPNRSRKVKNLFYVGGSTVPGIGLPMCLISAQLVYKRLAGERRGGPVRHIKRLVESPI